MWIFNKDGFFSVVQKPDQRGTEFVTVRSRSKKDIVNCVNAMNLSEKEIIANAGTDYEYRVEVSKNVWSDYISQTIQTIDYDNFKHEIEEHDVERANVYLGGGVDNSV
jgi:hypothetical protein